MFLRTELTMVSLKDYLELWCNKCADRVPHDLIVTTDNEVVRTLAGSYRDENKITRIVAACNDGHRQTIQ